MRDTSSGGMRATLPGLRLRDWPVSHPGRVLALAGQAPGLSEEQVLVGLVRVVERAVRVLGGGSGR